MSPRKEAEETLPPHKPAVQAKSKVRRNFTTPLKKILAIQPHGIDRIIIKYNNMKTIRICKHKKEAGTKKDGESV